MSSSTDKRKHYSSTISYLTLKEGYCPLLKLFVLVSASLQCRRLPDEAQFGIDASTTRPPYLI
eukprot:scaffold1457_cov111-Skeletonema_dohrnii-CCMP3373.AAC.10